MLFSGRLKGTTQTPRPLWWCRWSVKAGATRRLFSSTQEPSSALLLCLQPQGPTPGTYSQDTGSHFLAEYTPCSPPVVPYPLPCTPYTASKALAQGSSWKLLKSANLTEAQMSTWSDFLISSPTSFWDANMIKFFTQFISIMLEIQ